VIIQCIAVFVYLGMRYLLLLFLTPCLAFGQLNYVSVDGFEDSIEQYVYGEEDYPAINESGFYLDVLLGTSTFRRYHSNRKQRDTKIPLIDSFTPFALNFRAGNKFYYGNESSKYRPGLVMEWLNVGINTDGILYFDPVNFGITNAFSINELMGIESSVLVGFNLAVDLEWDDAYYGFKFSPIDVKFKYDKAYLGLNIGWRFGSGLNTSRYYALSNCQVSIGKKF